jgi:SAM-dependent methyltransferase
MIEQHRRLLADTGRNQAYAAAIRRLVIPGRTHVADLGTGTGLLAMIAARAGAASVWACDGHAGTVALAKQVAAASGLGRIRFAAGHSATLAPPRPVDVLVSEILGNIAWEEHMVETLGDARRWLAPGGVMLPCAVEQYLCPVMDPTTQTGIDVFPGITPAIGLDGDNALDYSPARRMALANCYVRTIPAEHLLDGGAAAVRIERLAFPGQHRSRRRLPAAFRIAGAGTVHGLALWWSAELVPGLVISTAPDAPPTHWEQIYLPLMEPIRVRAGDVLETVWACDTAWDAGCVVTWSGSVRRRGQDLHGFRLSNRDGFMRD